MVRRKGFYEGEIGLVITCPTSGTDCHPHPLGAASAPNADARAETSWQAVADAPDIDVVSVVVANHLHREIVEGLLSAGKHVLCEKPFAPTVAEAEAMVAAARARLDEAWRAQIAAIVEDGIMSGEFAEVDSADFAIQLAALLDGLAIEVMLRDPTVDAARMEELAIGFVEMALKTSV